MQGIKTFIPTEKKVQYIQSLLRCGFDTIDFGSFVSPKAIPQMVDTKEVLAQLDLSSTKSKLLAIVANLRGAQDAVVHPEIDYLGYPFSISENFQMRNTNKSIDESFKSLIEINNIVLKSGKKLVIYLSMCFGQETINALPSPGVDCKEILPPTVSRTFLTIANPMPLTFFFLLG